MANNDKLRQIISNIQALNDITNSMTDSEIYPVSFFSQAFDLMHKIESNFHALEADQVELFASQMEKHHALILSIHRQIRHIDTPSPKVITEETVQQPIVEKEPPLPKKVSLLSRLSLSKEPPPPPPPNPPKKASKIIEAPIEPPVAMPPAENEPPQPVPKEKSTITLPETLVENRIRTPHPAAPKITEGSAPPSVNDVMEKRKLSDLRKAFSLNDRFRYCRELFGGNEEVMNRVITTLNSKDSYKESMLFLEEKLHWDFTNPTVKDFIKVLELRFL